MEDILKRAQQIYGYSNQLTVAVEELCELACVLSKYPRYPNHEVASEALRDKVLDELADVFVVTHHVKMIFDIGQEELMLAVNKKIVRLDRWLKTNDSMYQTVIDRKLEG